MKLTLPPLAEQRAIAHILGTLDDKIELNRRMNETLEAMARALFKSWFVDFDPVRAKREGRQPAGMDKATAALFPDAFQDSPLGKIPKGWQVERIEELVTLSPHSSIQAIFQMKCLHTTASRLSTTGELQSRNSAVTSRATNCWFRRTACCCRS